MELIAPIEEGMSQKYQRYHDLQPFISKNFNEYSLFHKHTVWSKVKLEMLFFDQNLTHKIYAWIDDYYQ